MMMNALIQQIASGIATGAVYASLAVALVMIYQSTNLINFAQGEMAMLSTYLAWSCINAGWPYWAAFAFTVAVSFAVGFVLERIVLRPLRGKPDLAVFVVLLGLLIIFNSLAGLVFGYDIQQFPSPFPTRRPFGTTLISFHALGTIVIVLAIVVALYVFLRTTRVGLAMRASAQNPNTALLAGIPVALMLSLGWGAAAAIGAVGGMLIAPVVYLDPNMMGGVLIYGFAAALLGGIDNPWGAVAGGVIVGVVENLAGAYVVGTDLKLAVALVMIIGVLLLRPSGLFGRQLVTRV